MFASLPILPTKHRTTDSLSASEKEVTQTQSPHKEFVVKETSSIYSCLLSDLYVLIQLFCFNILYRPSSRWDSWYKKGGRKGHACIRGVTPGTGGGDRRKEGREWGRELFQAWGWGVQGRVCPGFFPGAGPLATPPHAHPCPKLLCPASVFPARVEPIDFSEGRAFHPGPPLWTHRSWQGLRQGLSNSQAEKLGKQGPGIDEHVSGL